MAEVTQEQLDDISEELMKSVAPDEDGFYYYTRTYSLRTKDGIYAWIYDDDETERFQGVTFQTPKEAQDYVDKRYGRTYVKFENRTET